MDFQHYKTEKFPDYTPSGTSHWYIKGSPERFTSKEILQVYKADMNDELRERWNWVLTDKSK